MRQLIPAITVGVIILGLIVFVYFALSYEPPATFEFTSPITGNHTLAPLGVVKEAPYGTFHTPRVKVIVNR